MWGETHTDTHMHKRQTRNVIEKVTGEAEGGGDNDADGEIMMFFFSARKLMLGGQNPDSTVHYQSTQRPPGDPPTQNSVEIKQPLLLW